MSLNEINTFEDAEMKDCDDEKVVTMMDVLQEQEEFEEDANAVLGASDDKDCTYHKGYVKRQALYACMTCSAEAKDDPDKRAGVCLACSLNCHENHDLIELYTKRNFRCDCGNHKLESNPCHFFSDKEDYNEDNKYDQNFCGLYCICHKPYPDPENNYDDEMIQCIICEDWLHASHLEAPIPTNNQYSEMICQLCMANNDFLNDYSEYAVNYETDDVNITNISDADISIQNTDEFNILSNGTAGTSQENEVDNNQFEHDSSTIANDKFEKEINVLVGNVSDVQDSKSETTKDDDEILNDSKSESTVDDDKILNGNINDSSDKNIKETSNNADDEVLNENLESSSTNKLNEVAMDTDLSEIRDVSTSKESNKVDSEKSHTVESEKTNSEISTTEEAVNVSKSSEELNKLPTSEKTGDIAPEPSDTNDSTEIVKMAVDEVTCTVTTDIIKDNVESANNLHNNDSNAHKNGLEIASDNDNMKDASKEVHLESDVDPNGDKISENQALDTKEELENKTKDEKTNDNISNTEVDTETSTNEDSKQVQISSIAHIEINNEVSELKANSKRKLSTESKPNKKAKPDELELCKRPKGVKKRIKGASFWPSNFRRKLCTCSECIVMYKDLSVLFLIDPEDTVTAYETLGKEKIDGTHLSQYEKGLKALSSLDRIQQINALTEYNRMRDKLLDFLKSFKDRKEVVREEDIKAFFAGMKPTREPDGVYFCR